MNTKKHLLIKLIAVILIASLIMPAGVMAAEPRASDYLSFYSGYIYPAGWGYVQVWIEVEGTRDMDEIGALQIKLYESTDNENWSWVTTFTHNNYPDMLGHDDYFHVGHVEYAGTIGRYYKAQINIWAGKDGGGDSRNFWTPVERATLFAA